MDETILKRIHDLELKNPDAAEELRDIFSGARLPSLMSDTIAKRIYSPDLHPERLQKLLRGVSKDNTIEIDASRSNESIARYIGAKKMITDLPSALKDGRRANSEFQIVAQEFVMTRSELYASDMLLMQYSVREGQAKGDVSYDTLKPVILFVFMKHSPEAFRKFKSEHYIHRFTARTADTGLVFSSMTSIIFVQLDKCLKQFRAGKDGENNKEIQLILSALSDINEPAVRKEAEKTEYLKEILAEISKLIQEREVQDMIFAEQLDIMDYNTNMRVAERRGMEKNRELLEKAEQEKEKAEQEKEKAEQEKEKAEQEKEKAEQEKEKAEQEREKEKKDREKAEQENIKNLREVMRLRAILDSRGIAYA